MRQALPQPPLVQVLGPEEEKVSCYHLSGEDAEKEAEWTAESIGKIVKHRLFENADPLKCKWRGTPGYAWQSSPV